MGDAMDVTAAEGFFDIDGVKIEYRWIGPGSSPDKPTLVFLHEGLGCVALWRDFPDKVVERTGLGALVYSRQGYGKSDPCELPRPVTFMHTEGLEILPKVLEAAGIEQAILIGHSDGGSIALIHAGSGEATRVKALILMAAHVFNEEVCVTSIREAKVNYEKTNLRDRLARYHGDNVDCAFRGWNDVWLDPDFWNWNIEEFLPGITVPTLVMQGEDDQYGTEAQVKAIVSQIKGPVEKLMIPDCRHSPQFEQPEAALHAIERFVASVV
jgi:pimeloyl-ACP methyl ester carboxylesterase